MPPPATRRLLPALIYVSLTSAVVSSLGMLLVPTIAQQMHVPVSTGQWMLTINLLVGAVTTPVMGRLSDGPYKKRLLQCSLLIILTGSIVAACAPNFTVFLVGRALQGPSYGVVPVTIALAQRHLPSDQVRPGISALSVTAATGLGVGYPLTGILASLWDFRVPFWFAAVFLISALVVVWRVVPGGRDHTAEEHRFDISGALSFGLGLSALLVCVSQGPVWGWTSAWTAGCFALAVAVLAGWTWIESRVSHPMVNLRAIRHGDVVLANCTAIGLGAAMYLGLSIGSLIAQSPATTGYGIALPLFWAGFVMLPLSVGSFGANRAVRSLSRAYGMAALLPIGAGVMTTAAVLMWLAHDELWEILIGMFLFGVGIGTTYAAMPALIARSVIVAELGSAVSFNQVLRTVGGAFGSAVSGAVLAAHTGTADHPTTTGITVALTVSACGSVAVFAALTASYVRRRLARGHHHEE